MKIMGRNHHRMDALLLVVLFSGCLLSISGESTKNPGVQSIFRNFKKLMKAKTDDQSNVCVQTLKDLNKIENAFGGNEEDQPSVREEIDFSLNCGEVQKLKTEFLKAGAEFEALLTVPVLSQRYKHIKMNMELKMLEVKSVVDSVRKMVTGERLEELIKMQEQWKASEADVFKHLNALESAQTLLNDANVESAITQLKNKKLDEAAASFAAITDGEIQIKRIIAAAYNGNGDNFKTIHLFIGRLPSVIRLNGLKALYELLKKNDGLQDHRIWVFAAAVSMMPEKSDAFMDTLMADIKAIIRNKNFDGLVAFLNNQEVEGLRALEYFASLFALTMYEETGNSVEQFISFTDKLTVVRHRIFLLNELIAMLKISGGMHGIEMTRIVYELIKLNKAKDLQPQDKIWLQKMEHSLPDELRDLMYKNLCIKNAENGEYLYASVQADEKQRHVYTATTMQPSDESFYWQVYLTNNGTTALISNVKDGGQLYLLDERDDDDVHVLRCGQADSMVDKKSVYFSLDMRGDGQFVILNQQFGQVMHSPFDAEPNMNDNRPIFSKSYDPKDLGSDSKWIISMCRFHVEYDEF